MPSSTFRSLLRVPTVLLLALTLALGTLMVASPAQAQKIRPSYWGMHDNEWTTPPRVPVGSANFTTAGTYWRLVEKSKGNYDWTRLDAQVAAAKAVKAQPMIVLGQTPKFRSKKPGATDYYAHMPKLKAWKRWVSKVAARYGTRLDYQIWPEPNIIQNWKGSPRQMAKLTMVAAKAIARKAGKRAKVVSPAVAIRLTGQQAWTIKYFKQSVGGKRVHKYVDAIAIDPFPALRGKPEDSFKLMKTIRKKLARIGVRKPFWNNEINYGVEGAGANTPVKLSVDKQQSYVIRTYALSAAARMQRTYWLGWFSTNTMAVKMADSNGMKLPPGKSYEVVRSWLNKTNFKGCNKKKSGLWVCKARKGKKEVRRIYWKPKGKIRVTLPKSRKRLENQEGGVNQSPKRRIRVNFKPVMVASRK